jgi:hypothetical protein
MPDVEAASSAKGRPPEAAASRGGRTTRERERTVGIPETYAVAVPLVNDAAQPAPPDLLGGQ